VPSKAPEPSDSQQFAGNVPPHVHPVQVNSDDIDFMGHANNARYLNWIQEAVTAHWTKSAPPSAITAFLWVAVKHEITYRAPGFLNDDLTVVTTLTSFRGVRSFYSTSILSGIMVLAEAQSTWCSIDATRHRPARIPQPIVDLFLANCRITAKTLGWT
jgi:acyl-CoA thioester hydrolase